MDKESAILVLRACFIAAVIIGLILFAYCADKRQVRTAILRCAREHRFEVLSIEPNFFPRNHFAGQWLDQDESFAFAFRIARTMRNMSGFDLSDIYRVHYMVTQSSFCQNEPQNAA
jgi:hypothetical protein